MQSFTIDRDILRVSSLQHYCVHDGPGVRSVIFLKGCFLKCPWCCNPESISYEDDLIYNNTICIASKNSSMCTKCEVLGGNTPRTKCPIDSYSLTYQDYRISDFADLILSNTEDLVLMGGITISGGEPLFQAEPLTQFLRILKEKNIHVALESSLYSPFDNLKKIIPYCDYWIVDLKFQLGYFPNPKYKDISVDVDKNLEYLRFNVSNSNILYRMVVIDEMFCNSERIVNRLKQHGIQNIELLVYHSLGQSKYAKLNLKFIPFSKPDKNKLTMFLNELDKNNINYKILNI